MGMNGDIDTIENRANQLMTGTQLSIWELLDITPTKDVKIVAEAVAAQLNQHNDAAKIEQLETAWRAYQTAQVEQANWVSIRPPATMAKSNTNVLINTSSDEQPDKLREGTSIATDLTPSSTTTASIVDADPVNIHEVSRDEAVEVEPQLAYESKALPTLQSQVESFLDRILNAINTSAQQHDSDVWQPVLNDPSLTQPTFVEAASFSVFHLIVSQHNACHFTPSDSVAEQLWRVFNWREQESSLRRYFSRHEVETGLALIYGNEYTASTAIGEEKRRNSSFWSNSTVSARRNVAVYVLIGMLVMFSFMGLNQVDLAVYDWSQEEAPVMPTEPYWAEDLTVCNQAKSIVEDEAFAQCLALAEQGRVFAQMRVAWLFFESEDEDHLQMSYDWMLKAGNYDDTSKLLSKILLLVHGTTPEDKLKGYKGIVREADSGFAGAEAYLALLYLLDQNLLEKTANPVWLLEKAYRNDADYVDVWDLIRIYLNGLETKVDKNKAVALMTAYANSFFPTSANNAAWMIATAKDHDAFKPSDAVLWAESVVQDPNYSNNFGFIDTLAAAYAADGQFERAVTKQKQAIALLEKSEYRNETDLEQFNSRLMAFSKGQSVAYLDIVVDANRLFPMMKKELEHVLLEELKLATVQP